MTKKRPPKETAEIVAKTVADIRAVLKAVPIMSGHKFFNEKEFKDNGLDKLITKLCKQNKISEDHIRRVAGLS